MATLRCETHKPAGRVRSYVAAIDPAGPVTCGAGACKNPARLWLQAKEKAAYDAGERVFRDGSMKVRAR